jgi:hypothetical protein
MALRQSAKMRLSSAEARSRMVKQQDKRPLANLLTAKSLMARKRNTRLMASWPEEE